MVNKIHRDAMRSEAASLRALLERSGAHDPLGTISLRQRLRMLEEELASAEAQQHNSANVALVFDGEHVRGSSAIDADFAGRALQNYQELIAKHVAIDSGRLPARGRLPDYIHDQARMNVTALVHGSFGFVLEEDSRDQLRMFETPARKAVHAVTDLLSEVSASDGNAFEGKLDDLDIRIFQTLKKFVESLHKAKSTLKVSEERRELNLDASRVERAFERLSQVNVEEIDESVTGELLGLVPIQRRFEFRRGDNGELLQGGVAESISADYLERIESEGMVAGAGWRATIRTKTIHHPDGRHTKVSRLLIDLVRT